MGTVEHSPLRRPADRNARGQAAVEFVFALVILLAFVAVLFQALHFELDVFNKSGLLRYRALKAARQSQEKVEPYYITDVSIEGEEIGNLTFYTVPFQEDDLTQHYGPKRLVVRRGTQYWDPLPLLHEEWQFSAPLLLDHYEPTSGKFGDLFGLLNKIGDQVPE